MTPSWRGGERGERELSPENATALSGREEWESERERAHDRDRRNAIRIARSATLQ